MTHVKARRSALFGAVVGAVVLCLASVAFACSTKWYGELKVWGAAGGTATAIGSNVNGQNMSYCAGYPNSSVKFSAGKTQTLTVSIASATDACTGNANKLPAGWYDINIIQTAAFTAVWTLDTGNGNCMDGGSSGLKTIGSLSINASGNGQGTAVYTAGAFKNGGANGAGGGICVASGMTNAIEAPVVFI